VITLIDLTQTIGPLQGDSAALHGEVSRLVREVGLRAPGPTASGPRDAWCASHGIALEHVPDAVGFELDVIRRLGLAWGTRIDAPLHSAAARDDRPLPSMADMAMPALLCDGMVLDLREACRPGEAISINALQAAIDAVGRDICPGDAVLLRTGQERFTTEDPEYANHPGMTREGTLFLTMRGVHVVGTDALAWDRPFPVLHRLYEETGDPSQLWDGHLAIREREAFIVQQLRNLGALPPTGFKVAFFPLKVAGASASPCRAVALLIE